MNAVRHAHDEQVTYRPVSCHSKENFLSAEAQHSCTINRMLIKFTEMFVASVVCFKTAMDLHSLKWRYCV